MEVTTKRLQEAQKNWFKMHPNAKIEIFDNKPNRVWFTDGNYNMFITYKNNYTRTHFLWFKVGYNEISNSIYAKI